MALTDEDLAEIERYASGIENEPYSVLVERIQRVDLAHHIPRLLREVRELRAALAAEPQIRRGRGVE